MSLLVIYRACPGGSLKERPIEPKEKLIEFCFTSFLEAFKDIDYKLKVLIDKPNTAMRNLFEDYDTEETFYPTFGEGNIKSFHRQIDLALTSDLFLFVEDDYYFLPESGPKLLKAIKEFDFVTPYDHPGYYTEEIHKYKREVEYLDHHWTTVISTTLTFGGNGETLRKEAKTMKEYGWADHPMWVDITKRRKLWCPIPSLATHMETPHLAHGFENL